MYNNHKNKAIFKPILYNRVKRRRTSNKRGKKIHCFVGKKFVDRMLKANYALEWHSNFERTQV